MEIKVDFCGGLSIDTVLAHLQEKAKEVNEVFHNGSCILTEDIILICNFNDSYVKSSDTIDEAYVRITGMTKAELDEQYKESREKWRKEQEEWKASIPSKIPEYCDKARGIIREDKYEYWDSVVPIRLGDLYQGMELDATLEILTEWNKSHDKDKCKEIINIQGHSGMSYGLVVYMIEKFAKGNEKDVDNLIKALKTY